MSIKRLLITPMALLALTLAVAACSSEDEPYFSQINTSLKGTDCLAESFSNFDVFLKGGLSNGEVSAFWDCALVALNSVDRYMIGSTPSGDYKSTDVRWFVGKYFLKSEQPDGIVINDDLLEEMMEVKRVILGGNRQILSRKEISGIRDVIKEMKELSLIINPHIKVLFYSEKDNVGQTEVGKAIGDFARVIQRLGDMVQKQGNSYEFARMIKLVEQIDQIMKDHDKDLPKWLKYVPAIQKFKGILLNSSDASIANDEWSVFAKILGDCLGVFFRAKYFFNTQSLYSLDTVLEFRQMYKSAEHIFTEAFAKRQNAPITNVDVDGLINAMSNVGILPADFNKEDARKIWVVLVDQILAPNDHQVMGFSPGELGVLTAEFEGWYRVQRWLLGEEHDESDTYIKEMQGVLDTPWSYVTDDKKRLVFHSKSHAELPINVQSAGQLNWIRAAIRLVMMGYGKTGAQANKQTLTKDEVNQVYLDVKPLLVQFGLVDADNTTFQDRLYLEANLFMPRANGDANLDFYELVEYIHFVLSGIQMGKNLVKDFPAECALADDLIVRNCYRDNFKATYKDKYANMPRMVKFFSGLSAKDFNKALDNLEKSTRDEGSANTPVLKSDIYEMGIMLMYIETIMFRYDVNRSEKLEIAEGLAAVPLFQYQLGSLIKTTDKNEIRRIFTFMLKYGEPPNTKNPISLLRYLAWRWGEKKWSISTDRFKMISILASIGEQL